MGATVPFLIWAQKPLAAVSLLQHLIGHTGQFSSLCEGTHEGRKGKPGSLGALGRLGYIVDH